MATDCPSLNIIKSVWNDDIRRLVLKDTISFHSLCDSIRNAYKLDTPFVTKYKDDENELVTISSDLDLMDALKVAGKQGQKALKVYVFPSQPLSSQASPDSKGETPTDGETKQVNQQPDSSYAPLSKEQVKMLALSLLNDPIIQRTLPQIFDILINSIKSPSLLQDTSSSSVSMRIIQSILSLEPIQQHPIVLSLIPYLNELTPRLDQLVSMASTFFTVNPQLFDVYVSFLRSMMNSRGENNVGKTNANNAYDNPLGNLLSSFFSGFSNPSNAYSNSTNPNLSSFSSSISSQSTQFAPSSFSQFYPFTSASISSASASESTSSASSASSSSAAAAAAAAASAAASASASASSSSAASSSAASSSAASSAASASAASASAASASAASASASAASFPPSISSSSSSSTSTSSSSSSSFSTSFSSSSAASSSSSTSPSSPSSVRGVFDLLSLVMNTMQSQPQNINAAFDANSTSTTTTSPSAQRTHASNNCYNMNEEIHHGVQCDQCGVNPIVGFRYKCSVCQNFDLCSQCEQKSQHPPNHAMMKIRKSKYTWEGGNGKGNVNGWGGSGRGGRGRYHQGYNSDNNSSSNRNNPNYWKRNDTTETATSNINSFFSSSSSSSSSLSTHVSNSTSSTSSSPTTNKLTSGVTTMSGTVNDHNGSYFEVPERSSTPPNISKPKAELLCSVTIPDGVVVAPGSTLVKTWKVKNNGNQIWPIGTRLAFAGNDRSLCSSEQPFPVPQATPGSIVEISTFICAPVKNGRYLEKFRLADANGDMFGPKLWVDITVDAQKLEIDTGTATTTLSHSSSPHTPSPSQHLHSTSGAEAKSESSNYNPELQYAIQLNSLAKLGCNRVDLNIYLLEHYNGNVDAVYKWLIENAAALD